MKTLYLECGMGAAGDMLTAALLELTEDRQAFVDQMNALGLPGVQVSAETAQRCGITGTHVTVLVDGAEEESCDAHHHHHHAHHHHHTHEQEHAPAHHHAGMQEIAHMIGHLDVSERVKTDALAVYQLIAEAESHAHGRPVDQIHFHEVGTADAVADIVGVCLLIEQLAPERIVASPVHVGCGSVHCAHGILPVPAPATAHILRGVPTYGGSIQGELCTPTGAALLRYFVQDFGGMPAMRVQRIGYGMGKKEFEQANCVRAMLGETADGTEDVVELSCNVDDMTAEELAFVMEQLFAAGALDVYTIPVGMKKSRIGSMLTCMCHVQQRETMLSVLFRHTTTLGVREHISRRYTLRREQRMCETPYGTVRVKTASGWGVHREKLEYEDLAKIACDTGKPLAEIRAEIMK